MINGTENIWVDPLFSIKMDWMGSCTSDTIFNSKPQSCNQYCSNGFTDYPSHDILGKSRSGKPDLEPRSGSTLHPRSSPEALVSFENQTDIIKVLALDNEGESLTFSIRMDWMVLFSMMNLPVLSFVSHPISNKLVG